MDSKISPQVADEKKVKAEMPTVDVKKIYDLDEAMDLVKKTSKVKFDASVELHITLGIDPKKGEQQVRATVSLPHGTGKEKRIAVFVESGREEEAKAAGAAIYGNDELIKQIASTGACDFDIAVATPAMMPQLAKVAKVLGPRGLMPNPKTETVTNDIAKAVKELKGGKVTFKNDDTANLHQVIGKVSFTSDQLKENFNALFAVLKKSKPSGSKGIFIKSASLASTMGPGIRVKIG